MLDLFEAVESSPCEKSFTAFKSDINRQVFVDGNIELDKTVDITGILFIDGSIICIVRFFNQWDVI
jgi:hypothetical protein